MARDKKVEIGALNITMHPHSAMQYVELFREARRLRCYAQISRDKGGAIASVHYWNKDDGETSALTGEIYRFTKIDEDAEWFNEVTGQHAEEDELDEINLPDHLRPNSAKFTYIFFPEHHLLFFEKYGDSNSLGHTTAEKIISKTFNNQKLTEKYGKVDVTIIPAKDKLQKALDVHSMTRLAMLIKRPNADELEDAEVEILKRMQEQNVAEQREELIAISGDSIKPSKGTRILAEVAAKNGTVEVHGKNKDGRVVDYKTTEHPWADFEFYNPTLTTSALTIMKIAQKALIDIKDWVTDNG